MNKLLFDGTHTSAQDKGNAENFLMMGWASSVARSEGSRHKAD
jgi:hypothetical protein